MTAQPERKIGQTLEKILTENYGLSRSQAQIELAKITASSAELVNQNNPEINERLDLLSELSIEELSEELSNFMEDMASGEYSEKEQLEMTNEIFNIIGFGVEKNPRTSQFELKLVEPAS